MNVLMGTYGACGYVPGIKPSVFRRQHASSSWTNMPRAEIRRKEAQMHQRIYDALAAGDNPELAEKRRGFLHG
jgi:DNA-binding FadR family transcriptional regulator